MFGCYFIAAIVLIIWLSSEESPSQYDYTQGINQGWDGTVKSHGFLSVEKDPVSTHIPECLPFPGVNLIKTVYNHINSIETCKKRNIFGNFANKKEPRLFKICNKL